MRLRCRGATAETEMESWKQGYDITRAAFGSFPKSIDRYDRRQAILSSTERSVSRVLTLELMGLSQDANILPWCLRFVSAITYSLDTPEYDREPKYHQIHVSKKHSLPLIQPFPWIISRSRGSILRLPLSALCPASRSRWVTSLIRNSKVHILLLRGWSRWRWRRLPARRHLRLSVARL